MLSYIGFTRLIRILVRSVRLKGFPCNALSELLWLQIYTRIVEEAQSSLNFKLIA
jgi:hypothetical protein